MLNIVPADRSKRLWWLPDFFSITRGGLAVVDAAMLWHAIATNQGWDVVFWLTLILLITDWIDGFFARLLKVTSDFGALLDTLMDKLAVVLLLVLLVMWRLISSNPWLNWGLFSAIVLREAIMTIGRPLLKKYYGMVVKVQQHGRFKMWVQAAALVAVPASHYLLVQALPWEEIVPGLFWAAAFTTLQSLYTYGKDVSAQLKQLHVVAT